MKGRIVRHADTGKVGVVASELSAARERIDWADGTATVERVEDLVSQVCETCREMGATTFLDTRNAEHVTDMLTAREPFTGFVHETERDDGTHVCGFAVDADDADFICERIRQIS